MGEASKSGPDANQRETLDLHADRTRAWWMHLVAGQLDQPHPVHGADLDVRLDHSGLLLLKGTVHSQADLDLLLSEAREFEGHGISEVRCEVVVAEATEKAGLLVQTLMSAFERPEQAQFALEVLHAHAHLQPKAQSLVEPGMEASLEEMLPEGFRAEAAEALQQGRTIMLITLDETVIFTARQLLEEETRSLWTVALPPQAASKGGDPT